MSTIKMKLLIICVLLAQKEACDSKLWIPASKTSRRAGIREFWGDPVGSDSHPFWWPVWGSCSRGHTNHCQDTINYPLRAATHNLVAKSPQSCPTLHDPIDGSPPGSPVPGILQARILEWVAISFSRFKLQYHFILRILFVLYSSNQSSVHSYPAWW